MSDAAYHELFPLGADEAPYRQLTTDHVSAGSFDGRRIVKIERMGQEAARPHRVTHRKLTRD